MIVGAAAAQEGALRCGTLPEKGADTRAAILAAADDDLDVLVAGD